MVTAPAYPKVKSVRPLPGKKLRVEFDNDVVKTYDCTPLLEDEVFSPLRDERLFRLAHAEEGGYAVIWNDRIDLAESELWLNGTPTEPGKTG